MGTKQEPSAFDCYAKAEPNEPIFILRGKDPSAPFLVRLWVASRRGSLFEILKLAVKMWWDDGVRSRWADYEYQKLQEARNCAQSMWRWRNERGEEAAVHELQR